jgi:hypothetical protein
MTNKEDINDEDIIPPVNVAKNAAKGLELHGKYKRGGTKVGWARARQLKNREAVSSKDIVKIASYFARHEIDKQAEDFSNNENPSNGYIAWLLWGGDEGQKWANNIKEKLTK